MDPAKRMTATQAAEHPWLLTTGASLAGHNLGKNLDQLRIFNATRKLRGAIQSVRRERGRAQHRGGGGGRHVNVCRSRWRETVDLSPLQCRGRSDMYAGFSPARATFQEDGAEL